MATRTKKKSVNKKFSKEEFLHWYRQMYEIRKVEEKAGQLYGMQKIRGFLHLYIGQEAVGVGIEAGIRKDDYMITAYRDHGNAMARGMSANKVMAELYGKATGCSKGKGGSMHFFDKENNFLGGHGIVGGQVPLGAGLAFAIKYKKEDKISVTMMGDGAVRQGAMHEAFNLSMLWNLPVLYIIENNMYAMGTSIERTSNVTELHKLGLSYDMPSEPVDGMDFFAVKDAVERAAEHIRSGKGPYLLEMRTYRFKGHSMSDPGKYRTKEELMNYKSKDPVVMMKAHIITNDIATEDEIKDIEAEVKKVVKECVDFAENSPFPDDSELYNDIYTQADYPFITE